MEPVSRGAEGWRQWTASALGAYTPIEDVERALDLSGRADKVVELDARTSELCRPKWPALGESCSVQGAHLPSPVDLPPEIRSLSRRQAIVINDDNFHVEAGRLIHALESPFEESGRVLRRQSVSEYGEREATLFPRLPRLKKSLLLAIREQLEALEAIDLTDQIDALAKVERRIESGDMRVVIVGPFSGRLFRFQPCRKEIWGRGIPISV